MKKIFVILLGCVFVLSAFAKSDFPIQNNPLPSENDTLRVLLIGNSFTYDVALYIDEIIKSSNIDSEKCCVYILYGGGYSIFHWWNRYNWGETFNLIRMGGLYEMDSIGTVQEILHQNWDVVGLQQTSDYSDKIDSFSPYLYDLVRHVKEDCTNDNVSICWQLTWSYWDGLNKEGPKEEDGWKDIVTTTDQMISLYGIDIIIPSGTAVENARNTRLNTKHSFTRDGHHIAYGTGHYLLACTFFESIFKPIYHVSVLNNKSRPAISESFKKDSKYEYCEVTDETAYLCQLCAIKAVENWHTISIVDTVEFISPSFIAFPNPTSNNIIIQNTNPCDNMLTNVLIQVTDIQGHLYVCQKGIFYQSTSVDISNLPNNQYFVQIVYDSEIFTIPIIKTK